MEVLSAAVPSVAVVVVRLNIARRHQTTNHLEGAGPKQTGGARALDLVPSVTLDWLFEIFGMPDVIKIDVEGAEVAVLLGGAEVMRHLPTIMCEVAVRNSTAVASGSAGIDTAYTTATCLARSERRSRPLHPTRRAVADSS